MICEATLSSALSGFFKCDYSIQITASKEQSHTGTNESGFPREKEPTYNERKKI